MKKYWCSTHKCFILDAGVAFISNDVIIDILTPHLLTMFTSLLQDGEINQCHNNLSNL